MMAKKSTWNDGHDIRVKGYEVELYPQESSEPHHSTGVYSVLRNTWLTKPKMIDPKVDIHCVKHKAESMMYEIDNVLKSPNRLEKIKALKEKIRNMRQAGLERSGEFSVENLAFKVLRRNGYLKKLYDTARKDYDSSLSLKQETLLRNYLRTKLLL
jgi:DNA-binding transcriptional ArsR family regulator